MAAALALLWMIGLFACAEGRIASIGQLDGGRVGVQTGSSFDGMIGERLPDARVEYYNTKADLVAALNGHKVDAFVVDEPVARILMREDDRITYLPEYLDSYDFAFVFPKGDTGEALREQFNAFLEPLRSDGTLDALAAKWFGEDEDAKTMPDIAALKAENGTLRLATESGYAPFEYVRNGDVVGYDMELAARFCAANGYGLEIVDMNFDGILPSVQAGKCDFAAAGISITPERAESVLFSEPNFSGGTVAVVLKADAAAPVQAGESVRWQDYNGKRIGVLTGPLMEDAAKEYFPDSEYLLFNSYPDCIAALLAGKIDAFLGDEPELKSVHAEQPKIDYIRDHITQNNYSFAFRKNDPESAALCAELNEFLARSWEDGTMQELDDIWFGVDEDRKVVDMSGLTGENGIIRVVTTSTDMPFSYIKDGKNVGYDIDLVVRFCRDRGYGLELGDVDFAGRIPAIESGKYDFTTDMNVTPEREEQVLFSDPTSHGGIVLAILTDRKNTVAASDVQPEFVEFSDLSGKTVSMLTGAPFEELVKSKVPDVGEFTFFNTTPDMIQALKSQKTDAFLMNNAVSRLALNRNPDLALFPQNLQDGAFGIAFAKDDPRRDEWQAAYDAIPQSEIEKAWDKWTGTDDNVKILPEQDWPGLNGTVQVAACDTLEPMSYVGGDNALKGFDLEIILMMARELDVKVEFTGMEFSAILAAVQSGKADLGAGSIIITDERAQAVDFVEYYPAAFVLVVRASKGPAAEATEDDSALSGIASSFNKTFLREERWRLFAQGVLTTLLITLLSILFGTALGFMVFMLCRNGAPLANLVTRFCLWLVQGMPMVVLLMILYYVVFGSIAISGVAVAVIGFTLTFGAAVFGLLKMGVGAVDNGQYEAAYALGYSNRRTFFRIILPQALPHVLPAYKGEIVGLIKATAIVGYIAVQDLTKMGDIVRSRTYEAFFPLIAITIIYFALEALIGFAVSRVSLNLNPKRRRPADILKGVKIDDQN